MARNPGTQRPTDHRDGDPIIAHMYQVTGGRLPIIGVGGIFDARDAYDKIRAGATPCRFIPVDYEGPGAVKRINRGLLRLIKRDG